MHHILIVEDNPDMQFLLQQVFKEKHFRTTVTDNGYKAIEIIHKTLVDIVLLDIRLPETNGIDILEKIKSNENDLIVIMMTAFGDIQSAISAMKLGAYDYITKPFNNDDLLITIQKALENRELKREVKCLKHRLQEKTKARWELGSSSIIQQVIKQVDLIAPTSMSIIIQGESGTGKEVYANLIHNLSLRKKHPFVAVDCGAIPENLIESELFGYDKGAFTGAESKKKGKFEEAYRGTLLLDEITNLPFEGQAKLLRAIQERKIQRVGGKEPIHADVRIIATTNVDIYQQVQEGRFRDDLFHRLNEYQLKLPPLRKREGDVPVLAKEFLEDANLELKKTVREFSHDAMLALLEYDWPGNVRELKHVIKRAVLLCEDYRIEKEHLQLNISADKRNKNSDLEENEQSLETITTGVEKNYILRALKETHGNKTKAAKLLNIHRKTLYRKLRKLGLE